MKSILENPMNWTEEEYANFGREPQNRPHRYNELPWWDDEAIIKMLDTYPRENLQAHTMGEDTGRYQDWKQVNISAETTGKQMLDAVKIGRIWLNLTTIERHKPEYSELINGMYAHIAKNCSHLQNTSSTQSALLISSPGAQVYYHLDSEPNMLWHMRGQKNIWLYPAMDMDFTPQDFLEDIYAEEITEDLPYSEKFDESAVHYLLGPGDAASWPHNAPHRIANVDLNVSLATSYYTPAVYKRQYVQLANRFLLRPLGIKNRSMEEVGVIPSIKRMTYRVISKIRPFKRRDRSASYTTNFELDPTAPMGMRILDEPVLPVFAKASWGADQLKKSKAAPWTNVTKRFSKAA